MPFPCNKVSDNLSDPFSEVFGPCGLGYPADTFLYTRRSCSPWSCCWPLVPLPGYQTHLLFTQIVPFGASRPRTDWFSHLFNSEECPFNNNNHIYKRTGFAQRCCGFAWSPCIFGVQGPIPAWFHSSLRGFWMRVNLCRTDNIEDE